jgi:hypothetical protein
MYDKNQIDIRRFLIRWVIATVVVWPITIIIGAFVGPLSFEAIEPLQRQSEWAYFWGLFAIGILIGAPIGFSLSILQKMVVRRWLYRELDHWIWLGTLGGAIGCIFIFNVGERVFIDHNTARDIMDTVPPHVMFMICLSSLQWFSLRQYVHAAWLWIPVNIISTMFWNTVLDTDLTYGKFFVWAVVLGAILTGSTLYWLFQNLPRDRRKGKPKHGADEFFEKPEKKKKGKRKKSKREKSMKHDKRK